MERNLSAGLKKKAFEKYKRHKLVFSFSRHEPFITQSLTAPARSSPGRHWGPGDKHTPILEAAENIA